MITSQNKKEGFTFAVNPSIGQITILTGCSKSLVRVKNLVINLYFYSNTVRGRREPPIYKPLTMRKHHILSKGLVKKFFTAPLKNPVIL